MAKDNTLLITALGITTGAALGYFLLGSQPAAAASEPAQGSQEEGGGADPGQILSLVGAYQQGATSPEVIRARIANYEKMLVTPGLHRVVPGDTWYRNQIEILKAKLAVAQESTQATRDWRSLGQTVLGVTIVAGVAATALLAVRAVTTAKGAA